MNELVFTLLRIGFLIGLWLLVISVVATLRRDVYGIRVKRRRGSLRQSGAASAASAAGAPGGYAAGSPSAPAYANPNPARPTRKQSPRKSALSRILVTDGPLSGTTIPLGQASIIVGRSPDSALVLDDSYSSARHARFFRQDDQWYVEDLQSTNGTFVRGQRIDHPIPLQAGMKVVIGQTTFEMQR